MTPGIEYLLAFLAGIFGSLHCIGMCGGLVSAFFMKIGGRGGVLPYVGYHTGRLLIYTVIGVAAALLGMAIGKTGAFGKLQGTVQIIAGIVIILIGLDIMKVLPWSMPFEKLSFGPVKKLFKEASQGGPFIGAFTGGVLNGFIPCNLLYAMAIEAAATAEPLKGGLLMAAFGFGTLPSMLSVSFLLGKMGAKSRGMLFKLAAVTIIIMGCMTLYRGTITVLQLPVDSCCMHDQQVESL